MPTKIAPHATARPWSRTLAAAASLCTLAALPGCGSSGSGNADPASLVPASAPLYASVAIKPAGGSSGTATVAAKKLTHLGEPYGSLAQALLASVGGQVQFKRDIEPWVGERAGVFITALHIGAPPQSTGSLQSLLEGGLSSLPAALGATTLAGNGTQGAIVLQTSDTGAARSFLAKRASEQRARTSSYRGVALQISPQGLAEGIVKNFAVIGSESGVKSAIDTSLGAASLASSTGYQKPTAGTIASIYAKPQELLQGIHGQKATAGTAGQGTSAPGSGSSGTNSSSTVNASGEGLTGQGISLLGQLFAGAQSVSLSATATDNAISLQGEVHSASSTPQLFGAEGAQALGELPATSWLAAGVSDTGTNLSRAFALLRGVASLGASTVFSSFGGASIERLFKTLDSPKAELQQNFGSWAGAGGMFIGGSGLFNLQAALVIASKDPTASRAAVGKLARLMQSAGATVAAASIPGTDAAESVKLQGFPATIFIADGAGKFVVGLGQQSIEGALAPSATLSTSPAYSQAAATLGDGIEPSLIVEFPTLLGFLEGIGLSQGQGVSGLVPYLKSLGTLTAGASGNAGVEHFKVVLGLA